MSLMTSPPSSPNKTWLMPFRSPSGSMVFSVVLRFSATLTSAGMSPGLGSLCDNLARRPRASRILMYSDSPYRFQAAVSRGGLSATSDRIVVQLTAEDISCNIVHSNDVVEEVDCADDILVFQSTARSFYG